MRGSRSRCKPSVPTSDCRLPTARLSAGGGREPELAPSNPLCETPERALEARSLLVQAKVLHQHPGVLRDALAGPEHPQDRGVRVAGPSLQSRLPGCRLPKPDRPSPSRWAARQLADEADELDRLHVVGAGLGGDDDVQRLPVRLSITIRVIGGIPCSGEGRERERERRRIQGGRTSRKGGEESA